MLYGILVGVIGALGGTVGALWYARQAAALWTKVVEARSENAALKVQLADRDKSLADDIAQIKSITAADADELNRYKQLLEATRAELDHYKAAVKVLRLRAHDPAAVAEQLGQLFPVPKDGGQDGHGNEGGQGTGGA